MEAGVSCVVPVKNGALWIADVIERVLDQELDLPLEVVVVEDGSTDGSAAILASFSDHPMVRIIPGGRRGAAAAINHGIREARFSLIAQVDQDVLLEPGWMASLVAELDDPQVAGAQGYYATDPRAPIWARIAGYDLEHRYGRIRSSEVNHICTGNSIYRTEAVHKVGGFDESIGYGYDNDMSYRLTGAGYHLRFVPHARSIHRWRETMAGYLRQQYGQGYGRLDLVTRHPHRVAGDHVSGLSMILHVPATFAAVLALATSLLLAITGGPWLWPAAAAGTLVAAMLAERLTASLSIARRIGDPAALLIAPAHLLRNLAWVAASVTWGWRRLVRRGSRPQHSMRAR